ncbi:hypothetical protein [Paraburkholderia dilworthii]|uniref:hypothetical protein n=1 Tax=Paraburkholderia dilworthii TaxID=948106 RepID=UPI0003FD3302|nr:hypothetical protein [Paraburkholderia dilworthii]
MNSSTPLNTATAVGAGAVVAPVVSYIASLFHATLPADVQSAVVVLVVAGAHWVSKVVAARSAAKQSPAA